MKLLERARILTSILVEIKLDAENESALESSLYLVYIYLGKYTKSLAINQTSLGPLSLLKPLWLKVHLSS